MNTKILGYILSVIGIVGVALSYPDIRTLAKISLPAGLTDWTTMIIGLVFLAAGLFLLVKRSSYRQPTEVPIYHGKNIVGYRRMHN